MAKRRNFWPEHLHELGVPKKFTQEQIFENIKKEYARRLRVNGIETDPITLPEEAWADKVRRIAVSQHHGVLA